MPSFIKELLEDSVGGFTLLTAIFGFIGSCLGISYMPPMTGKQQFFAVLSGVSCGMLMPELAVAIFATSPESFLKIGAVKNGLAFLFGILGMFFIPGVIVAGQAFSKNPWFVVDWLRGKGPPPGGAQ